MYLDPYMRSKRFTGDYRDKVMQFLCIVRAVEPKWGDHVTVSALLGSIFLNPKILTWKKWARVR